MRSHAQAFAVWNIRAALPVCQGVVWSRFGVFDKFNLWNIWYMVPDILNGKLRLKIPLSISGASYKGYFFSTPVAPIACSFFSSRNQAQKRFLTGAPVSRQSI
jgi:hypothetical protein